ncbi:MAG TPA: class I SAM-dependent methyltransferase [Burkholderiaceae bacterium]|jgi:SAM-dependent methyltransferase|nr:class I SAM-dependent methyltransferase [Burkholderiaceae bacterium]
MTESFSQPSQLQYGSLPADAATAWNDRFRQDTYVFGTEPNAYLRRHAGLWKAGQRVLCVADGEGRNSVWLAQRGLAVDAFDISDAGIGKAKKLADAAGVTVNYSVSDCDRWSWPTATYDGVALIFAQFANPDVRRRLFANIVASLKAGGVLVLQGYTPQQLVYDAGEAARQSDLYKEAMLHAASYMYTETMLRAEFSTMEILDLREYEEDLDEGTLQHGRSALIGLAARKP